jgi:hypothetical protein
MMTSLWTRAITDSAAYLRYLNAHGMAKAAQKAGDNTTLHNFRIDGYTLFCYLSNPPVCADRGCLL